MDWFRGSLNPKAHERGAGSREVVNHRNSPTMMEVGHVGQHDDLGDPASMIRVNKAKKASNDSPNSLEQAPRELDLDLESQLDKLTPKVDINNEKRVSSEEMIEDEDTPKKVTMWERASKKCCESPTTIWVAIFAPLEMIVWVFYAFACLSFMTVKFLTLDDLVDHKITDIHGVHIQKRSQREITSKAISDVSGYISALKRGEKGGLLLNSGMSITKRSLGIIQGCGLDYITTISSDLKTKDSDLQHSHEGRRLFILYFILQPLGQVVVVAATVELYFDKRMCEFDYAYENCCLRSVLFYFIILVVVLKIPQNAVFIMHWKKLGLTIKRHREFRKSVVLCTTEKTKCRKNNNDG